MPDQPDNRMMDVARPGKTPATATSRPVISDSQPLQQDSMVLSGSAAQPLDFQSPTPEPVKAAPQAEPAPVPEPAPIEVPVADTTPKDPAQHILTATDPFGGDFAKKSGTKILKKFMVVVVIIVVMAAIAFLIMR